MKGNEDSFGFNLDQTGCGQVPIIPLSGLAFILDHIFQKIQILNLNGIQPLAF